MSSNRRALSYILAVAIFLLPGGICSAVFAAQSAAAKPVHSCCHKDKTKSTPQCCPSATKAALNNGQPQQLVRLGVSVQAVLPAAALPAISLQPHFHAHHLLNRPLSRPTQTGAFALPLLV